MVLGKLFTKTVIPRLSNIDRDRIRGICQLDAVAGRIIIEGDLGEDVVTLVFINLGLEDVVDNYLTVDVTR